MKLICGLFVAAAMAGCAGLENSGITFDPNRTYTTQPVYLPVTQPNFQPFGSQANEYQLIMINTPSGLVQKRCKVLNGRVVHCL